MHACMQHCVGRKYTAGDCAARAFATTTRERDVIWSPCLRVCGKQLKVRTHCCEYQYQYQYQRDGVLLTKAVLWLVDTRDTEPNLLRPWVHPCGVRSLGWMHVVREVRVVGGVNEVIEAQSEQATR